MEVIRRQPDTKRGPAEWFTGDVWIDEISPGPHVKLLSVHFTPGARTAWHVHPFGQLIHVTEGLGLFQVRGEPVTAAARGGHGPLRLGRGPLARRRPDDVHDAPGDAGGRRRRQRRDLGPVGQRRGVLPSLPA